MAWGRTTFIMVCPWVIPIECAASNCPLSIDRMPPRTISAMYAPVLIDTIAKPARRYGIRTPKAWAVP